MSSYLLRILYSLCDAGIQINEYQSNNLLCVLTSLCDAGLQINLRDYVTHNILTSAALGRTLASTCNILTSSAPGRTLASTCNGHRTAAEEEAVPPDPAEEQHSGTAGAGVV